MQPKQKLKICYRVKIQVNTSAGFKNLPSYKSALLDLREFKLVILI